VAGPATRRLLTGWGRTTWSAADVVAPLGDEEVREHLLQGSARGVLARGLGRSYGDVAQNAGGTVLDMTGLGGIVSIDEGAGIVRAQAGCSFDALLRASIPLGLFLPVSPGTRQVTVGGAIANDIHGKNHHLEGSFATHVRSLTLLTPDGDARSVTPEANPRLFWATAGGLGLTGVILDATIEMLRVETAYCRVNTQRLADLDACMEAMAGGDDAHRYSVAWIDLMARGANLGRSVLSRGDHARRDELPVRRARQPRRYDPRPAVPAPLAPARLLSPSTVRAFNEAWYRKAPHHRVGAIQSIPAFFHPLDSVAGWNRLYGRSGLVQYQIVVPFGAEATLRRIVGGLSSHQCPSFLAVLKRFGPQLGMLSFPAPGWTLALDIPARFPGLRTMLDGMDNAVVEAGGRVYLAKDARMGARHLRRQDGSPSSALDVPTPRRVARGASRCRSQGRAPLGPGTAPPPAARLSGRARCPRQGRHGPGARWRLGHRPGHRRSPGRRRRRGGGAGRPAP